MRLQVRSQDFGEYVNRVFTRRDFDTTISSNTASPRSGDAIQRLYWSQAYRIGVSFSNAMHYQSPEVDRLLEQAQVEVGSGPAAGSVWAISTRGADRPAADSPGRDPFRPYWRGARSGTSSNSLTGFPAALPTSVFQANRLGRVES